MKRKLSMTVLTLMLLSLLVGCGCEHEWTEADCVTPKTCALCQETEGAPVGHTWSAATCTAPKTCQDCAATEGEALGHDWEDATCILPKKCAICHETEGSPLSHTWEEATTELPKTCTLCQATEGSKLDTDPRFTTESTKHLYGLWSCEVELTGEILGLEGYFDGLTCTLFYEFGKTGDLIANMELHDNLAFIAELKRYVSDLVYESLAYEGLSKEDADEAMVSLYGMTMEEYVDAQVEAIDLDEIFGMFTADMVYYVGQTEIYISDSWYGEFESSEYTLEDGVLIIEKDTLGEDGEPLQWKRVED